jgi:hypothetical protein
MPRGSFNLERLADCLGDEVAVGAMRASVGIATDDADLDRLESFLRDFVSLGVSTKVEAASGG